VTPRPAPPRPPTPRPEWQRSGPSERCSFGYHVEKCDPLHPIRDRATLRSTPVSALPHPVVTGSDFMVTDTAPKGGQGPTLIARRVLWDVDLLDATAGMDVDLPQRPGTGVDELVGYAGRRHHDLAGANL
jgi:hypothetical protein